MQQRPCFTASEGVATPVVAKLPSCCCKCGGTVLVQNGPWSPAELLVPKGPWVPVEVADDGCVDKRRSDAPETLEEGHSGEACARGDQQGGFRVQCQRACLCCMCT